MTAHLYCWVPSLDLDPEDPDLHQKDWALCRSNPSPSPKLAAFVEDLLSRYPDLMETEDTV